MTNDRPVASISGTEDWAWNRWQAERRARSSQRDGRRHRGQPSWRDDRHQSDVRSDPREDRTLETALHKTEQRRQLVIAQYERILAEKDRELTERGSADVDRPGRIRSAVRRLIQR